MRRSVSDDWPRVGGVTEEEAIRLLQSINDDGGMGELIVIPRVVIQSIRALHPE